MALCNLCSGHIKYISIYVGSEFTVGERSQFQMLAQVFQMIQSIIKIHSRMKIYNVNLLDISLLKKQEDGILDVCIIKKC